MANKTVYVDGTTSTGHYATLQAAITGELAANADLVSMAGILNIEISMTSADTTPVDIAGFTTSASYYVNIYTTAGARHRGKWDTGRYRLDLTGDVAAISVRDLYTRITGVQAKVTTTSTYQSPTILQFYVGGEYAAIKSCIGWIHSDYGNTAYNATAGGGIEGITYINCVFTRTGSGGAISGTGNGIYSHGGVTITALNCTVSGFVYNYVGTASGILVCKNCISQASGTAGYVATTSTGSDYNLSDRADALGSTVYNSKTLTFVDAANGDFHLAAGDTDAMDKGTSLSGTFTDDIDGATRSGTWDLGADEYTGGGGSTPGDGSAIIMIL